jgi:hypothetical protein
MNSKILILLSTLLVSTASVASNDVSSHFKACDFDSKEEGVLITFNDQSPQFNHFKRMYTEDRVLYNNWYKFTNDKEPLAKNEYVGRHAFIKKSPVKTHEEKGTLVSYYAAISDNCESVFMRVAHDEHSAYFNESNVLAPMEFNFIAEEYNYGYIVVNNFEDLERSKIKSLYVKPNSTVWFVDKYYQKAALLPDFAKMDIIDAKIRPYVLNNQPVSSYFIQVSYNGEEGFIPGNMGNYLFNDPHNFMNTKTIEAIKEGKVYFGMSLDEVRLSLGEIVRSVDYDVYKTHGGVIIDYNESINEQEQMIGKEYHVYFKGNEVPFIFNSSLSLDSDIQRFNPYSAIKPLSFFSY